MRRPDLSRHHGFTLVELLTVMAIISALAAMLLPTLARVIASMRAVECMNNLKQFGISAHAYNSDFGCIPPDSIQAPEKPTYQKWHKTLAKAGHIEAGEVSGYYTGVPGPLFTCPEKKAKVTPKTRRWNHFETDYGLNYWLCYGKWLSLRKLSMPSSTYFIGEKGIKWDAGMAWWEPYEHEYVQHKVPRLDADAHNERMNMLFFDGHVELLPGFLPPTLYQKNAAGERFVPWGNIPRSF